MEDSRFKSGQKFTVQKNTQTDPDAVRCSALIIGLCFTCLDALYHDFMEAQCSSSVRLNLSSEFWTSPTQLLTTQKSVAWIDGNGGLMTDETTLTQWIPFNSTADTLELAQ